MKVATLILASSLAASAATAETPNLEFRGVHIGDSQKAVMEATHGKMKCEKPKAGDIACKEYVGKIGEMDLPNDYEINYKSHPGAINYEFHDGNLVEIYFHSYAFNYKLLVASLEAKYGKSMFEKPDDRPMTLPLLAWEISGDTLLRVGQHDSRAWSDDNIVVSFKSVSNQKRIDAAMAAAAADKLAKTKAAF